MYIPLFKRKGKINTVVKLRVQVTSNNFKVIISDINEDILYTGTTGKIQIKGKRRKTQYAAMEVINSALEYLRQKQIRRIQLYILGARKSIRETLKRFKNLSVISIEIINYMTYNGCRASHLRRV